MLWNQGDYNIKIFGNVSNYPISLQNVYNYQFRSLFNIGNTPPMNKECRYKNFSSRNSKFLGSSDDYLMCGGSLL